MNAIPNNLYAVCLAASFAHYVRDCFSISATQPDMNGIKMLQRRHDIVVVQLFSFQPTA